MAVNFIATDRYLEKYRAWESSMLRLAAAKAEEESSRHLMQQAWHDVKAAGLPDGAYASRECVVLIGGEDYPKPLVVMRETELLPCGCRKARGCCEEKHKS